MQDEWTYVSNRRSRSTRATAPTAPAPTQPSLFAKRRLLKDLKELMAEGSNLTTITALPTESLFTWHCNLRPDEGPYAGTIFHIILEFPQNYPHSPPKVNLCTSMRHPNVFDGWRDDGYPYICLDMLKEHTVNDAYAGWTSAYTVMSLLLQLQSFLFSENVPQEYGGYATNMASTKAIRDATWRAQAFTCTVRDSDGEEQVHSHECPWPPLPEFVGTKALLCVAHTSGHGHGAPR